MCLLEVKFLRMHALRWKMEDRFPELSDSDLKMKKDLVIEW